MASLTEISLIFGNDSKEPNKPQKKFDRLYICYKHCITQNDSSNTKNESYYICDLLNKV